MRLPWRRDTGPELTPQARAAVCEPRERVLATAREKYSGAMLVVTTGHLTVVDEDGTVLERRSWVDVFFANWEPLTGTLTVTWTDGGRSSQWTLGDAGSPVAEMLHERVASSVVVSVPLEKDDREIGRAAIRRHPLTGELFPQLVWGRGGRGRDPEKEEYGRAVLAHLCEQAGIDPPAHLQPREQQEEQEEQRMEQHGDQPGAQGG